MLESAKLGQFSPQRGTFPPCSCYLLSNVAVRQRSERSIVAACTLALSPIRDTLIEGFSHFVASMTAPIASGWSESPGGTCTHWKAPPCHGAPPEPSFLATCVDGRKTVLAFSGPQEALVPVHSERPRQGWSA